ncbi:hypothetical protein ACWEQ1_16805 [Streptomyces nodosus]
MPISRADAPRRLVGDRLVVTEAVDETSALGCTCGELLSPASENWKEFACRSPLSADDLGVKVRLHPELLAEGFACPGCGSLLAVEVRWHRDEPLHDLQIG